MAHKILLVGLILASSFGVPALTTSASTLKPTIMSFSPTTATVGTRVTIKGTRLAGATKVTFNGTPATIITSSANKITADSAGRGRDRLHRGENGRRLGDERF